MPPAETPRIAFAHVLRGFAALAVVMGHFGYLFWTAPNAVAVLIGAPAIESRPYWFTSALDRFLPVGFLGHFGVALFFLISGFVIPFSLVNRTRLEFAVGRLFRIWPTYAIGLGITVIFVAACSAAYDQPRPFPWTTCLLQLLFVRDLVGVPSVDGIVWTLEIEAKFYVLIAVLASAVRDGRVTPIVATAGLLALGAVALAHTPIASAVPLVHPLYGLAQSAQTISYMLIGTLINYLYRGYLSWPMACALAALLFGGMSLQWIIGPMASGAAAGIASYAIALGVFVVAYIARQRMRAAPAALIWLADISYPLYAVHGLAGYVLMRVAYGAGLGIGACIAVAMGYALLAAWALRRAVELPTQLYGRSFARRLAHWASAEQAYSAIAGQALLPATAGERQVSDRSLKLGRR
jgi:peptidoglycan/LPS O-acetylase OafA/YrhL